MGPLGRFGCLIALGLFYGSSAYSAVIYQVTVSTSGLNLTNGIVEMQFNPGMATSQAATATVTAFSGAPLLAVEPMIPGTGVVTGTLPGPVGFTNTAALNDYAQNVTFLTFFQFMLTLDGPAITAPNNGSSGTRFSLLLWQPAFANPLITSDGVIATLDINPNGTITINGFPSGASVVTFAGGVPEPSTLFLSLAALGVLACYNSRIRNSHAH
jgi:hypothetical protein